MDTHFAKGDSSMCFCGCPRPQAEIDIDSVLLAVPMMLEELKKVSDLDGKLGGKFSLMEIKSGKFVIEPVTIGEIINGKDAKYEAFCKEKPTRLREHILCGDDHVLSWESRNPEMGEYGGSISDGEYLWSFSGLSEEQDEALMLMSSQICGRIMNGAPEWYAKRSQNQIILGNEYLFWKH